MIEDNDIGSPSDLPANSAAAGPANRQTDGLAVAGRTEDARPSDPTDVASAGKTGATGVMTITFKLYATLQDLLPKGSIKNAVPIEIATDASLNEVIDRYKVPRELAHLVLVNGVFVCDADRDARGALQAGDVLAIWPPVAGG